MFVLEAGYDRIKFYTISKTVVWTLWDELIRFECAGSNEIVLKL